jgi:hypothetical protein
VTVKATPQQKSRSAYEMRRMGYSWVTIAAVVGYSTGQNAQRAATKFVRSMPPSWPTDQNIAQAEPSLEDLLALARQTLSVANPSPAMIRATATFCVRSSAASRPSDGPQRLCGPRERMPVITCRA